MDFSVVVPIRNAKEYIPYLLPRLLEQKGCSEIIIIDSDSQDGSASLLAQYPIIYKHIFVTEFNHGATRDMIMDEVKNDIVVFLTQDALPAFSDSLLTLVTSFEDLRVGVAYGRQLPKLGANPIEAHARLFNYPEISQLKQFEDRSMLGIKTAFSSNSFAAYRKSLYKEVGGFPSHVILSEDTFLAAKMLQAGYCVAYNAKACVYHSHDYTLFEEFRRYFDIGVFHANERWIREVFGAAEGEGMRFVRSEMRYLMQHKKLLIPEALFRTLLKWIGYRAGISYTKIPLKLCKKLSMHQRYWS